MNFVLNQLFQKIFKANFSFVHDVVLNIEELDFLFFCFFIETAQHPYFFCIACLCMP